MSKSVFVGELTWKEYEAQVAQGDCVLMLPVDALVLPGLQ